MTIKIYEADGGGNSIEFMNNGDNEPNVMPLYFDVDRCDIGDDELIYFNLSKSDAKKLIAYLKDEFKI